MAEKKQLYMIGNSHIDPVWFWNWEEGMQEVKATFASALERMKEFDDYKFTCTSTAFLKWIKKLLPEMFEEIRERVAEGRWEITGAWFIEPDCLLPCGEAFVRHGLYGQRFIKENFGAICRIGSNVDSFGHNGNLPQLLKKCGMDSYIFMRPRINVPMFVWESKDGSSVKTICLAGEYTTWFREPTIKNIHDTLQLTKDYDRMVCCYGVGNHGGGPTIENIETIRELQGSFREAELQFSTFGTFLEDCKETELPVLKGPFEKINQGCYSIDSHFKYLNRLAERRLLESDVLMSMAAVQTGIWMQEAEQMQELWETLLFNEFHDTMGGTTIKSAREEAVMQLSAVCARAGCIKAVAVQKLANSLDTRGDGFPLILINTGGEEYDDEVEAELEWFCQSPLKLLNESGEEIPYQRIHTDAKIRHTVLGGRRRFVFHAHIPACGYCVYRTLKEEPALCLNPNMELDRSDMILENKYLRAEFDSETGMLLGLLDKTTGYQALKAAASVRIYADERDAWGHMQGRRYEDLNEAITLESIEKVESGKIRETIRVRLTFGESRLEQLYTLESEEKELRIENRLQFNHKWTLLKMAYPTGADCMDTQAETAYGTVNRNHLLKQEDGSFGEDDTEYNMQRFLDIRDAGGRGLAIANDGKYGFNLTNGSVRITVARSAIYAQGNSPGWENPLESYEYTDLGMQTFRFVLKPHGERLAVRELYRIAQKINGAYEYLADSVHDKTGKQEIQGADTGKSMASTDCGNVRIMLIKKAEDEEAFILRLLELEGKDTCCKLTLAGREYPVTIGHHEIKTLKITGNKQIQEVNLLEW